MLGAEAAPEGAGATGRLRARWWSDDARWSMFGWLVVLNVLDVISTAMVLDSGGAERNPFVQPFVESLWQVTGLKVLVLVVIGSLLTRCAGSRIAELALAATTGWYVAVVSWNLMVLSVV